MKSFKRFALEMGLLMLGCTLLGALLDWRLNHMPWWDAFQKNGFFSLGLFVLCGLYVALRHEYELWQKRRQRSPKVGP